MADETPPFFTFDFKDGESLRFKSATDLAAWAADEEEHWKPILEFDGQSLPQHIRQPFDRSRNSLQAVITTAKNLAAVEAPSDQERANLAKTFSRVQDSGIPITKSAFPEFFADLRERHGDRAAAGAVVSLGIFDPNQQLQQLRLMLLTDPEVRLGTISAALFELGVRWKGSKAETTRLSKLMEGFETRLRELSARMEDQATDAQNVITHIERAAQEQLESHEALYREAVGRLSGDGAKAIEEINATKAAFTEHMNTAAAVDYWTAKGTQHRASEKRIRNWLFVYTAVGGFILILVLLGLAWFAAGALQQGNIAESIKYAAIAVLLTTIALWVGRVLLRFMISERHLAIDAEERVTMVKTYLALVKEATLEAADRPLVLSALFRSGSDGIVKDDSTSPDTMVTALLGRTLDRLGKG